MTRKLLITGAARSGTSLLASLLGAHSQINMLSESFTEDINKLAGKKYAGNKLCIWSQIRWYRASKLGHSLNRLFNIGNKLLKHRIAPVSKLSLNDYIKMEASIIIIIRNKEDTIKSMVKRIGLDIPWAEYQFYKANLMALELVARYDNCLVVRMEKLLNDPEGQLDEICQFLELDYEPGMVRGVKYNIHYPEYQTL